MTNEDLIKTLLPVVQEKVRVFLVKAKEAGFDLRITDGHRTPKEQDYIYAQGRTRPGKIVTNSKGTPLPQSNHNFQCAIDVCDRKKLYNIDWEKLGKIGESCGLEWGGRWVGFVDKPHFQYTGGLTLKQLQQGKRPQKEVLDKVVYNKSGNWLRVDKGVETYLSSMPQVWYYIARGYKNLGKV